jgi:hypothetical protein
VDVHGMPVRILVTEGTRADCKESIRLIEGISAQTLLTDWGYDTNDILAYAVSAGMELVIPSKKNRKGQHGYAETSDAFIAAVHIRCIAIWVAIRT